MPSLASARAALPVWITLVDILVTFVSQVVFVWALLAVIRWYNFRRTTYLRADTPWPQRAADAVAARYAYLAPAGTVTYLACLNSAMHSHVASRVPPLMLQLGCALVVWTLTFRSWVRGEQAIVQRLFAPSEVLTGILIRIVLHAPWLLGCVAGGVLFIKLPATLVTFGLTIGVFLAIGITGSAAGLGFHVARACGWIAPPSERLQQLCRMAAHEAGTTTGFRRAGELVWYRASLVAAADGAWVVASDTLLRELPDDQIIALLRESLTTRGEGERRWRWAEQITNNFLVFSMLVMVLDLQRGVDFPSFWLISAMPVPCAVLMSLLNWRRRRTTYDSTIGSVVAQRTYALALESLARVNVTPVVAREKEPDHWNVYKRLLAVGIRPTYDRPMFSRWHSWVAMVPALAFGWMVLSGALSSAFVARSDAKTTPTASLLAVALGASDSTTFRELAERADQRGVLAEAAAWYRICTENNKYDAHCPAELATVLAKQRRCDEARAAYTEAWTRDERDDDDKTPATETKWVPSWLRKAKEGLTQYCAESHHRP